MSADGTELTEHELDLVFRAFGFHPAVHAETVFAEADARRAERRAQIDPEHTRRLAETAAEESRRAWVQYYARAAEERRQRSEAGRESYLAHLMRKQHAATDPAPSEVC